MYEEYEEEQYFESKINFRKKGYDINFKNLSHFYIHW